MRFACLLVLMAGCGGREVGGDASTDATSDVAPPSDSGGACDAACTGNQVCVHFYYTHDPPPPLPEGGVCTYGVQRYDRCWNVDDSCNPWPTNCSAGPSCSCAPIVDVHWPRMGECDCRSDGTFNCYAIGL